MNKYNLPITKLIIIAFLVRMLASFLPPFEIDQIGWRSWALRMAEVGSANFYSEKTFTDNPPGFLYVFWLIGFIKTTFFLNATNNLVFDFLLKLPTNIADILSALIIYKFIKNYKAIERKLSERWALIGFMLYALNPVTLFNTSIWGQFDGSATLFLLLALYAFFVKKAPQLATFSFAIAWAIKPQAIALAPFLGLLFLIRTKPSTWISSGIIFILTTLLLYLPFFPNNPFSGIIQVQKAMTRIFSCTTCFAFNFWGVFGNWQDDRNFFQGLTLMNWGIILLALSFIPIFFLKPFKLRFEQPYVYLTSSLSIFAFFSFITRMHERYLFPFFSLFLVSAILLRSKVLLSVYFLISIIHLINVYLSYAYYNKHLALNPKLTEIIFNNFKFLSAFSILILIGLIGYLIKLTNLPKLKGHETSKN